MEAAAAAEQQKKQEVPSPKPQASQNPPNLVKMTVMKHRKRRQRQKVEGTVGEIQIDVKRPNSVLVDTSIRALLTNYAFSQLSPENQKILIESLPLVDRPQPIDSKPLELSPSSINNEFFNRACIEWRDRLAYGEFTNEHQTKLKAEQERDKSKIDPWKARNFEGIWGIKMSVKENIGDILEKSAMEVKGLEQGDFEIPEGYIHDSLWKSEETEVKNEAEEMKGEVEEIAENREENDKFVEESLEEHQGNLNMMPSQHPYILASVPTPPETVTSTQPDDSPVRKSPSPQPVEKSPQMYLHSVIAEATSSADDIPMIQLDSPEQSSSFIADDDDEVASHVELSSDGMPTNQQWYEHDYLKNPPEMEPESSGMDMDAVGDIVDDTAGIELIENDNAQSFTIAPETRISNYDAELPQEIFHKAEEQSSPLIINNFVKQDNQVMVVEQPAHYNQVVMSQQEANEPHYSEFVMDESEIDMRAGTSSGTRIANNYREEIRVPKNVKLLTFPSGVNYINNEKYIIEEQSQHIPHQSTSAASFRPNGATIQPAIQNSYFVGGPNFTYISKMGNKIETAESTTTTRIVKQEANNNVKQRIIYEISTEPKVTYEQPTHHLTYAAQPQPEIYHKMVNHNGTTTIYTESTGPPQKKTIIQRKKPTDPYTVQVALQSVANNNTIILTPIGNATTQHVQPQQQKSIVHIHRTAPIQQAPTSVQFLPQTTFLKKQTVIIPQQLPPPKPQPAPAKYTTVIRAPTPQVIQTQQLTPIVTNQKAHPKPIQKQKVIMSTSSLQQYRSYNHKNAHGSRKQLHPQHIIRPSPQTNSVIQSIIDGAKNQQSIPVMISSGNATETYNQISTSSVQQIHQQVQEFQQVQQIQQVISPTPTVVTINSAPSNSIFVHQKRPQQTTTIYQTAPAQQIFQQPTPIIQQHQQQQQQLQQQQLTQQQLQLHPRMRTLTTNHRPPPGAVNLERSYQICQAVIQNSPNRHQLNCQLKPPPTTLKKF